MDQNAAMFPAPCRIYATKKSRRLSTQKILTDRKATKIFQFDVKKNKLEVSDIYGYKES